jgi:cytoskeletal protein RodZ
MKTVGKFLKDARLVKKMSLTKVEDETKIKKEFIEAIEAGVWKDLPEYATTLGFVKNLAKFLGLDERQAAAIFRRDYLPHKEAVNPKPDVGGKFVWSPKLTFITGVSLVVVIILGYLMIQYSNFVRPPALEVVEPRENAVVKTTSLKVIGQTTEDATIEVNNQPVLVGDDGKFTTDLQIYDGTKEVIIKAVSRSGKETVITRDIKPEL